MLYSLLKQKQRFGKKVQTKKVVNFSSEAP